MNKTGYCGKPKIPGWAEHRYLATAAARTPQALSDIGNWKCPLACAHQRFQVEIPALAAASSVLQIFAPVVEAAHIVCQFKFQACARVSIIIVPTGRETLPRSDHPTPSKWLTALQPSSRRKQNPSSCIIKSMPTEAQKATRYYERAAAAHADARAAVTNDQKGLHRRIRDQLLHLARMSQQADDVEKYMGPPQIPF
jgi:hypothetical protein